MHLVSAWISGNTEKFFVKIKEGAQTHVEELLGTGVIHFQREQMLLLHIKHQPNSSQAAGFDPDGCDETSSFQLV